MKGGPCGQGILESRFGKGEFSVIFEHDILKSLASSSVLDI